MVNIYVDYVIKFNGKEKIMLSDFEYTNEYGKKFNMTVMPKGCHGNWRIYKNENNEIFASNNVWYSSNSNIIKENYELIEEIKFTDDFINKYPTIEIFNSLKCVKSDDLADIKLKCEEAILRDKEQNFILENTKTLFYLDLYDGSSGLKLYSQPIKAFAEDIDYRLTIFENYTGFTKIYDTLNEAYNDCFKYLEILINDLHKQINDYDNEYIIDILPTIKKCHINNEIKNYAKSHNCKFYVCNEYTDLYIMIPTNLFLRLKKTYKNKLTKLSL